MKPRPQFDHPLHELLAKRWSPRAFAPTPLTDGQVLTLLEAARWAASCNNNQSWRFIWAHNDASERRVLLLDCLTASNREWAQSAPLLLLALAPRSFSHNGKPNPWALYDLGLAMGNLTTQASALDIYVHHMGGFSAERAREHFNLPEELVPVALIALGYLGDPESLSEYNRQREEQIQTRLPLEELILN